MLEEAARGYQAAMTRARTERSSPCFGKTRSPPTAVAGRAGSLAFVRRVEKYRVRLIRMQTSGTAFINLPPVAGLRFDAVAPRNAGGVGCTDN